MATYTELREDEIRKILDQYDFGGVDSVESMEGGNANSSFLVDAAGKRYVLSVCDEKNRDEITVLTQALEHLIYHGVETSRLQRSRDGRAFIDFAGKPVYIKEYIRGRVESRLTAAMLQQVGEALARLHALPLLDGIPEGFAYGVEFFEQITAREGEFPKWLASRMSKFQEICDPGLPKGLIHGDLFHDNILFDRGDLTALLDFEEVCHYYFLFDIGMCIAGCCAPDGAFSLTGAAALISGYQSVRVLDKLEREHLQGHIVYGAAATAFWRFRQYNVLYQDEKRKDAYAEMKNLAEQVEGFTPEEFCSAVWE